MCDVTRVLLRIEHGDSSASEELLPLVYDQLRKLAGQWLAQEQPDQTLQATALVHEAYLRVVDGHDTTRWNGRKHFYAAAGRAMRRILVDNARKRHAMKRGGGRERIELPDVAGAGTDERLIALDDALNQFAVDHPDKAELVHLRYFVGCTLNETAEILGISRATAQRYWACKRRPENVAPGGE